MSNDLQLCPFCGSDAVRAWEGLTKQGALCENCGGNAPTASIWNMRAPVSETQSPSRVTSPAPGPAGHPRADALSKRMRGRPLAECVVEFFALACELELTLASRSEKPASHTHKCMRCGGAFPCFTPDICKAGENVMPRIAVPGPDGGVEFFEHVCTGRVR